MERFLSRIGGLIISPKETMTIIAHERRGLAEPFILIIIFSAFYWSSLTLSINHLINYFTIWTEILKFIYAFIIPWTSIIIGLGIAADIILWLLFSFGVYLMAKLVNGAGNFEDTLSIIGYSIVSRIFMIIPLIFSPIAPVTSIVTSLILSIASIIWTIYLSSLGISEIHGLTFEKALILVILIPLIIIGVLIIIPMLLSIYGFIFHFWRWIG